MIGSDGSDEGRVSSMNKRESSAKSVFSSLDGRRNGLNINKLKRMGPMIGLLQGQQGLSPEAGPFRAVRLAQ